jgi:hypothetical protein
MENRRSNRESITTFASIQQGDSVIIGKIHDVSSGGVFFEPEAGYVDGYIENDMEVDGLINIIVEDETGVPTVKSHAFVRWGGFSFVHGVFGFGLQWQHDAARLAA